MAQPADLDFTPYEDMFTTLSGMYPDLHKDWIFGKKCIRIDGVIFATFYKGDFVFKLAPDDLAEALAKVPGASRWDPSEKGRIKKEYVQVPAASSAYWLPLAKKAVWNVTKGRFPKE